MKKIIFITLLLFITKFAYAENKIEFEFGATGGQSNYTIDTFANSILKWRDVTYAGIFSNIKYHLSPNLNISGGIDYSNVFSGEMTDDDLANSTGEIAVYSRTVNMKGHQLKLDTDIGYAFYKNNNDTLSVLVGVRYLDNTYKPKGIYQIIAEGGYGEFLYEDIQSQHTQFIAYGPTVGILFENISEDKNFTVGLKGFIASSVQSNQSEWGYNWSIKGKPASVYGFDLKILQGLKMSEKVWINLFTNFEYLYGKNNLAERGIAGEPDLKIGDINYLQNYKMSLGISLAFK